MGVVVVVVVLVVVVVCCCFCCCCCCYCCCCYCCSCSWRYCLGCCSFYQRCRPTRERFAFCGPLVSLPAPGVVQPLLGARLGGHTGRRNALLRLATANCKCWFV